MPSPKVATYDQQAGNVGAVEVTDKMRRGDRSGRYDVIVLNYANADMVGHTGMTRLPRSRRSRRSTTASGGSRPRSKKPAARSSSPPITAMPR